MNITVFKIRRNDMPVQIATSCFDLLTEAEYNEYRKVIPEIPGCRWWLKDPGAYPAYAKYVFYNGNVDTAGFYVSADHYAVRPVLRIDNLSAYLFAAPGSKFFFYDKIWTILSENLAICDTTFCCMPFDKIFRTHKDVTSNYEKSGVKKYLDFQWQYALCDN